MPSRLQREQNGRLDDVDAQRLFVQTAHLEFELDLLGDVFGAAHLRRHGAAQQRNAGARTLAQPGAIQLMMLGGRAEIPQDRLVVLRQQREAADLVLRPGADVRRGDVAHVVHVEAQQRAHLRFRQQRFDARQPLLAQAIEIDALLPIHRHGSVSFQCHRILQFTILDALGLPHSARAASATVFSVGTVASSSGGENGIGTCIAPMRFTGASRS